MGGAELHAHAERVRRQRAAARRRRGVLEKWREQRHGLVCDAAGRFQALVEEARAREERDAELLVAEARRLGYVCSCIRLYVYIYVCVPMCVFLRVRPRRSEVAGS